MNYWFPFVNLLLFAILNGFITGGFMQIGPENVNDFMKEKVGFVSGFSLVFGIMLGTFLALPL
jgi:equilibrative nucleoside transporter 1/2/3